MKPVVFNLGSHPFWQDYDFDVIIRKPINLDGTILMALFFHHIVIYHALAENIGAEDVCEHKILKVQIFMC